MEDIDDQITFNIIDFEDLTEIKNKLKSICTKVDQKVIYLILQKLFNYFKLITLRDIISQS